MKHPVRWIAVMASIHVLLGTVGMWTMVALDFEDGVLAFPLIMLAPSQGALLGLWAAFGGKATPWRAVLAVLVVVAYFTLDERYLKHGDMEFWLAILVFQTLPFLVVLLATRLLGLGLCRDGDDHASNDSPRLQFSLARTIAWMTAFGIFLTAFHCLPKAFSAEFANIRTLTIPLSCSLVAAASFWLTLGRRWLVLRLAVLPVSIGLGTLLLRKGVGFFNAWVFATLLAFEAAWIVGSLIVVRLAGYRWTWRWRFRRRKGVRAL